MTVDYLAQNLDRLAGWYGRKEPVTDYTVNQIHAFMMWDTENSRYKDRYFDFANREHKKPTK